MLPFMLFDYVLPTIVGHGLMEGHANCDEFEVRNGDEFMDINS